MKRTLLMIRHAKSSWANPLQSDFERPLNERGQHDAPLMGRRLQQAGIVPSVIISSTARRTRETAEHIAAATGYDPGAIKWEEKLYHCIPSVFEELIYELNDNLKTVVIIAHNPGITEFVNQLSPEFFTGNMPTCGIVGAQFEAASWEEFPTVKRKVFLFYYPRNEHDS